MCSQAYAAMRKTHVLKTLSFVSIETNNLQMTTSCNLRKSMSMTGTFCNFHCDIAGNVFPTACILISYFKVT